MTLRRFKGLAATLAIACPAAALSNPVLDAGFGDNMVLQGGAPITASGRARPSSTVTLTVNDTTTTTQSGADGGFSVTLPAQSSSAAPLTLTVTDPSGSRAYNNILIGNVFLCGGQSNMELGVFRALDAETQIRRSADDSIRLLKVPKATAPLPQVGFVAPAKWSSARPETVADFSAACFFMAKALRKKDPATPIGLIHANWGGSAASAWLDPTSASARVGRAVIDLLSLYARDPYAATQAFAPQWFDWWRKADGGREPWRNPASLDWQPIPQFSFWNAWTGTGLDAQPAANVWLKQTITLTAEQARGDGSLAIGAIDDMDMTFVNGAPVGYTFGWGVERTYRVPAQHLKAGTNTILIAANNAWDTGGFFSEPERLAFTAANGERVPLGAAWQFAISPVTAVPPRSPWDANGGLGVMHNAMIAPLGRMTLAGVAWYQGESDVGQGAYDAKLAALIAGWRRQFGAQARILVVQLADFGEPRTAPGESGWAQLRDEQRRAVAADVNAALIPALDIGEPSDIHPANKNVLGERLAAAFTGRPLPTPERAAREGTLVTVSFGGVEGALVAHGGPVPLGAELCEAAPDSCRFVLARLDRARMVIPVPDGMVPSRVRYAWADAPVVNLYDAGGMPVPGFALEIAS